MLDATYWNDLYLKGDTGWDKGVASPPLARMLREGVVPKGSSIAVIGAGRGHDAIEAARLGYRVTAVDFAAEAAKDISNNAHGAGVRLDVLQADLFTGLKGPYDAVLEHTCFCAIDVARRDEYVTAIARALKPGGTLFGLFYAHGREGGPPFDVSEDEVRRRFSGRFVIERLRRAPDSFEARAGRELEAVFRLSPSES
ncbi:MAG: methyltransferase domain-containing protein [Myxococcaceae bacterium]|nr:methyltransferase domain-containing protein [Myxococcaceae bacterium]